MNLSNHEITQALDKIYDFFKSSSVEKNDQIAAAMIAEEVLLSFQAQFGKDYPAEIKMENKLGASRITIAIVGSCFNPTNNTSVSGQDDTVILNRLLGIPGVSSSYAYKNGKNQISISVSTQERSKDSFGRALLFSMLAGILCGICVRFLPANIFNTIISIATPLQSKIFGLVTAVTVPMIFFSMLSSICAFDSINELNRKGKRIIFRQFLISTIIIIISGMVCFEFLRGDASASINFNIDEFMSMLLGFFPDNLFTPFTEGNTLQLVVIALFTGACIILLESKGIGLKKGVAGISNLFNLMMRYVASVIPAMIFFSIFKTAATGSAAQLMQAWKLLVVVYLSWSIIIAVFMGYVCIKWKISPIKLIKTYGPVIAIAFSALSCTAAGPKFYEIAEDKIQINKQLFDFWYPVSTAFLSTSSGVPLVCVAFFAAYCNGISPNPAWLILCGLLSFQLSITSPRVAGGVLASYTIIISQLGIPVDIIGLITAVNFLFANACTGLGIIIKCIDITDLALSENAIEKKNIEKYYSREQR